MEGIRNARINGNWWDRERGLTHYISVEGDGWSSTLGGYHLGGECCYKWIMTLMDVLKCDSFNDEYIIDTKVRVRFDDGLLVAIGHFCKDIWLEPRVLFKDYK